MSAIIRGSAMAFNPFHQFRKHQKVIMAGMVVVAMITFIFSFGPGDLFTRGGFLGGWRGRGILTAEQKSFLSELLKLLPYVAWQTDLNRRSVFLLGGGISTDEMLDFMIWKHQADRLGITLSVPEIGQEVNNVAFGRTILQ